MPTYLLRIHIGALLLGARSLSAQDAAVAPVTLEASRASRLTIRGSTTIGARWHCTSTNIASTAILKPTAHSLTANDVATVSVLVPVYSLRCQSGAMERAMRKAMRAEQDSSSAIIGSFAARPHFESNDTLYTNFDGSLTVAGVQRSVVLNVSVEPESAATLRVRGRLPLTLSAFRITPPRVWFGAVRARDAISVDVDLLFSRRASDSSGTSPSPL